MALIESYPDPFAIPEDVGIFNELLKTIWAQERALLNAPLANIREYSFALVDGVIVRTLTREYLNVEVSVPDLDDEVIANSGGLVLPTDRFLSAYDVNPHILSVVEWPANSGNIFSFKRKEYNPVSGRLETLIRQGNNLYGRTYRRLLSEKLSGSDWKVNRTYSDILVTSNRSDLALEERMLFVGILDPGDIVYWALKESFKYVATDGTVVPFIPAVHDTVLDTNHLGATETYKVVAVQLDQMQGYYRLLCRVVDSED